MEMSNFLKIFVTCIALLATVCGVSQTLAVKAGGNLSKFHISDNDVTYSGSGSVYSPIVGAQVGVGAELAITEVFALEAGFRVQARGVKRNAPQEYSGWEAKYNLIFLDFPVMGKAALHLGDISLYGAAGPYVGLGLIGWERLGGGGGDSTSVSTASIPWGSDSDNFKRLDYGLNFSIGAELSTVQVSLNYGLGLANVSAYTDNGFAVRNRVLGVSLGYRLGL